MIRNVLILAFLLSLCKSGVSQEKYAIIINGFSPFDEGEYGCSGDTTDSNPILYEFWNDIYLMWETLLQKGFSDQNIYLLYSEGVDHTQEYPDYQRRYSPAKNGFLYMTDYNAYKANVDTVLSGLANGSYGFPQVKDDDFLFVYVFGHGKPNAILLPPHPINPQDDFLLWEDLNDYLDSIKCHRKVIVMQQCFSGACIRYVKAPDRIIMTAANDSMKAIAADTCYYDDIDFAGDPSPGTRYYSPELEVYNGDTVMYRHAEFNLHFFNSLNYLTPDSLSYYPTSGGNIKLSDADVNNDGITSISESYSWILAHDSKMRYDPGLHWDDPQLSDSSNIASQTSLEYPTLLSTNIPAASNITHRGLIGISKDIHVPQGTQLTIYKNAVLHLVNDANLIVDQGATLIIGDSVTITGTHSDNCLVVEGDLSIGSDVVFNSQNNVSWNIYLKNESQNLTLLNTEFTDCSVDSWCNNFTLTNGTITGCKSFSSHRGSVTITNTDILKTEIYLENEDDNDNFISLINNDFYEGVDKTAIHIWNYRKYEIEDNTIEGFYDGIKIMQCGYGTVDKYRVTENTITNCVHSGIIAYGSRGL